jgi:predicted PurR-regulated permease PerM
MAAALEQLRAVLPPWLAQHVPLSFDSLRQGAAEWLRGHADMLRGWGGGAVRVLGHVIAGVVVGAIAAMQLAPRQEAAAAAATGPAAARATLIASLRRRFDELADSFDDVVLAQLTISAINTALTAVFVLGILPLLGRPLPLAGTLVALTFFVGLLPVVGNLMSNTAIVLVALTQSPLDAAMALAWLVTIHKLEYFLNAHIVGRRIRAQAWELLCAMLLLEAMFGLAGLICAPIAYAQIKQTLHRHGWV